MVRCLFVLALTGALLRPPILVHAQEATPTPPPANNGPSLPSFPSASDIANALIEPLKQALIAWWQGVLDRVGTTAHDTLTTASTSMGAFLSALLSRVNFVTQLPPALTYNLPVVQSLRARMDTLAWALWPVVVLANVLWAGAGMSLGNAPPQRLALGAGRSIVAYAALRLVGPAQAWWIDFCNALSASLLSLDSGLPAMHTIGGLGQTAAELVAAWLYYLFALLLFISRAAALGWVDVLLVLTPLAIMLWALPLAVGQRFGQFVADQFLLVIFGQVIVAVVMALAAGIVTATALTGLGGLEQLFTTLLLMGGFFWLAFVLPGRLAHELARSPVQVVVSTATRFFAARGG
jgi:hypothetical protein